MHIPCSACLSYTHVAETLLAGIKSGSSTAVGLMSSPEPAVAADEGLISVHIPKNFSGEVGAPGSQYPTVYSFSTVLSS